MATNGGRQSVRERLASGQTVVGTMVFEFNTLGMPRILADAGAEFVLIDLEHTGWGIGGIHSLLAAARAEAVLPLVRVHSSDRHRVSTVLDAGAGGVMVAMVNDAQQAAEVVAAGRFPPIGCRGFGFVYPDQVASGVSSAIESANAETLLIVQIETRAGVGHAAEIASTPGVDVVWVGEFDLSVSLGVPGNLTHKLVRDAEAYVLRACENAGIAVGVLTGNAEEAQSKIDSGFRMIALGSDIGLYGQALRAGIASTKRSEF